jgi:hypothetical protein
MDILRCKTPEMVRKEVWAHLLVYNLIRAAMAEAAGAAEVCPRELSFEGARQTLEAFRETLARATATELPGGCRRCWRRSPATESGTDQTATSPAYANDGRSSTRS